MPIKDLVNRFGTGKMDLTPRGKPVRLGFLQKGERTGFGQNIKLKDLDHFRFKPVDEGEIGDAMIGLFKRAYGEEPREIGDVRIAEQWSGNFDPAQRAAYVAMKHTAKGSVFMAEGDGESIFKARNPETGKIIFPSPPWDFAEHTKVIVRKDNEHPHYIYGDKLYPWSKSLAVDLILPAFNELVYQYGLSGYGVVTFITHSNNDIPVLCAEYYDILDELVGLFANPMRPETIITARNWTPLRDIPLRLYRSNDKMTTPAYGNGDKGERHLSTRWLCHWQISPEYSAAIHRARMSRTALLIEAVGNAPFGLIGAGQPSLEQVNDDLYGPSIPATVPTKEAGPEWEDFGGGEGLIDEPDAAIVENGDVAEGEYTEAVQDGPIEDVKPPAYTDDDWKQAALSAVTRDSFCYAVYQLHRKSGVFNEALAVSKAYAYMFGEFAPESNQSALNGFNAYVQAMADGAATKKAAVNAAKAKFGESEMVREANNEASD